MQTSALQQPGRITKQGNQLLYTIKSGDTFYKLSQKLGVTAAKLQQLNPDHQPQNLKIGSQIKIKTNLQTYTVQPGDTIWKISQQHSLNPDSVVETNLMPQPNLIFPGEIIFLPKNIKTKLYFLKFTQQNAYLIAEDRKIPVSNNPYTAVIKELINGPTKTKNAHFPIPTDTEVKGVTLKDNIAYVNFGEKIRRSNVGSAGEHLLLLALANTLTEFKKVKGVKILVEGKAVETIGGHIVLDKPLRRSLKLVKEK